MRLDNIPYPGASWAPCLTPEEFDWVKTRSVRLRDKSNKSVEGSGLGLHIANELAEKHGIILSILPRRQNGTSVAIIVPKMGLSPDW